MDFASLQADPFADVQGALRLLAELEQALRAASTVVRGQRHRAQAALVLVSELADTLERGPISSRYRIERALRLESHWLHEDPGALPQAVYNRLRWHGLDDAAIRRLLPSLDPPLRIRHGVRDPDEDVRSYEHIIDDFVCCMFSPDGQRVLSNCHDQSLHEWHARSGALIRRIGTHLGAVFDCTYSPDGERILAATEAGMREWDARTGRELRRFGDGYALGCAYSPCGTRVLACAGKAVVEWDARSGEKLREFGGLWFGLRTCRYSPDGARVLAAASGCVMFEDALIEWDARSGERTRSFEVGRLSQGAMGTRCVYRADGARLLVASNWGLNEWDTKSGKPLRDFGQHGVGTDCAYSHDGRYVLGTSREGLKTWDAETGREVMAIEIAAELMVACAYSPDDARIVGASSGGTMRAWDARTGEVLLGFEPPGRVGRAVNACVSSPNGERVLVAFGDGGVREFDARSSDTVSVYDGAKPARTCSYSPDGSRVLRLEYSNCCAYDATTGRMAHTYVVPWKPATACAYSPDGSHVLVGCAQGTLCEWAVRSGRPTRTFRVQPWYERVCDPEMRAAAGAVVSACTYSPDGSRVLVAFGGDRCLWEWDVNAGEGRRRFAAHPADIEAFTYDRAGTRIACACADGIIREWDAATGSELGCFVGHQAAVRACAYDSDGAVLVSVSNDHALKIWSVADRSCLHTMYGGAGFTCLAMAAGRVFVGTAAGDVWVLDWMDPAFANTGSD